VGRGRPRQFDEREVLDRALELFWQRGYEGAGLSDLLEHMGISRQSLYGAFGSKRGLFLRVIEHYRETQLAQALALLERAGSPVENVRAVLRFFEDLATDHRSRGCLVANALAEQGPKDPEIARVLGETLGRLEEGIAGALEEGQRRGELPPERPPRLLATALVNAILGLAVRGRLPERRSAIGSAYEGTLLLLQ